MYCMKLLAIGFLAITFTANVQGQSKPTFDRYPVKTIFKGKPASVDLKSATGAKYYRTNLRKAAKDGVNFAGHYAIGLWGCGSPCITAGMVDLKTGKVTWVPSTGFMVFDVAFQINSKLVIINSRDVLDKEWPDGPPKWQGEWPEELFFVWNGKRFIQIK